MTARVGLFGWPVAHSISPALHNAGFAALGLDWHYALIPTPPDEFAAEVAQRLAAGWRGFNVTIPHKGAALALPQVRHISPAARAIGAVNTLVRAPDGSLRADNTDWRGFLDDLRAHDVTVSGADCLVLGTGGSARAVVYALEQAGACTITPVSREPARPGIIGYDDLPAHAPGAALIVNCTPVGMHPHIDASPWPTGVPIPPGAAVYDLVYNPARTRLLAQAEAAGARAIGGLGMLVGQGIAAFEQWTGRSAPRDAMTAAARAALDALSAKPG